MIEQANFPVDLISKYDAALPRYTSYPTALQFNPEFGEEQYLEHTERSNNGLLPKNLSLYIHIPFCQSLCYFCGCNKIVTQPANRKVASYLEALNNEIALRGKLFSNDRLVTHIHFGGGTPNFLTIEQITDTLDQVASQFHFDIPGKLDMSIEVDPRVAAPGEIERLAALGFNRFSIGVQDFSQRVQKAVNREQNEDDTLQSIATAIEVGKATNVDLIIGLPYQSIESFETTLNNVIASGVTRIAAYNFAYLPSRIKAQNMLDPSALPDAATRLALTRLTRETLLKAGYLHIGMDHFALPHDSLAIAQREDCLQRNFQGYSTHKDTDLIGLGVSSISNFDTAFAQNDGSLSAYVSLVNANNLPVTKGLALNGDDRLRSEVIQQIMCRQRVDLRPTISAFIDRDSQITLLDYFQPELSKLAGFAEDGLLIQTRYGFKITELGRYFMRPIAAVFDGYLNPRTPSSSRSNNIVPMSRSV